MKKKLLAGLIVVLLLVVAVPAIAAVTNPQLDELKSLYQQMAEIQKKMVDVRVKAGLLTKEQGEVIKKNIDARLDYLEKNPAAITPGPGGYGFGPGAACPNALAGYGGCGFGGGFGGCGFGGGAYAPTTPPATN
ncbi:YckD family protein [Carboxydothermus hydrogenoformans]|uniref:DUF2680 domain-containing protein n=1 Tax=Carboxydothermus hydrogenoformans (strain ATCC BAA-161 / DSM 6008 / Z-2901) TaxID=246194 RepID=Q3A9W8_CARHZ|nr:YckD family protein [Carboxydothermus hydrogenoformans]ABB13648.1 hypothetical protein CHY_2257 [Carboxydothermus hydrogenoformans Z-2901]